MADEQTEVPTVDPQRLKNFLTTVRRMKEVFVFTDGSNGLPSRPRGEDGIYVAVPFFSTFRFAQKVSSEFEGYEIVPVTFEILTQSILLELANMNFRIGMDWEKNGLGYDMDALQLRDALMAEELNVVMEGDEIESDTSAPVPASPIPEPVAPVPASNPYAFKFGSDNKLHQI
jgi:hypothetical protein